MPITSSPIPTAPMKKHPVRELVEEAGINVDDWAFTKDGDVIENPNDNISRNTNWSFIGKAGEPIVLCIWFDSIDWKARPVVYRGNESHYLQRLIELAGIRKGKEGIGRLNAKMRQGRRLQAAVYQAFRQRREVKLILVDGVQVPIDRSADESSIVKARELDRGRWFVHEYDGMTGDFLIVKDVEPAAAIDPDPTDEMEDPAEDPNFQRLLDTLDPTEREALLNARIGQGDFRDALIRRWGGCAVTGCGMTELCVASHLKPWSRCESRRERLTVANGLLLTPTLDKLLDRGLITFDQRFRIRISPFLPAGVALQLNINANLTLRRPHHSDILPYLYWHEKNIFRDKPIV